MPESNGRDLIRYETASQESLAEYHRRKRAEAELAALELQQELEAERSFRRWAVARAVANTIAEHPVATAGIGLACLWLLGRALSSRR